MLLLLVVARSTCLFGGNKRSCVTKNYYWDGSLCGLSLLYFMVRTQDKDHYPSFRSKKQTFPPALQPINSAYFSLHGGTLVTKTTW
jgi:hypothetical protein